MSAPTKVVIECTAEGWSVSVYADDRLLVDNRWEMQSRGYGKQAPNNADLEEVLEGYDAMFEAIDETVHFGPFGIAQALYDLRHDT